MGYYRQPEKTAANFVQNPLNKDYPEIIYKTGDLGYYNDRGELMFASRKDYQIKHMGHRIELAEIEIAVNALDFIDYACCLYNQAQEKITLFYQANQACNAAIIAGISEVLPKYMQPNTYVWLEKMPLNAHAKIDRNRLKETYFHGNPA